MSKLLKSIQTSYLLLSIFSVQMIEAAWSDPQKIYATNAEVSFAKDGKGNVMAVWNECLGTTANNVVYSYIKDKEQWYAPLQLSDTEERMLMSPPRIAVDANSNVVALWEDLNLLLIKERRL